MNESNQYQRSGVISIIGIPNAGKSTLLNACIQTSLSIVTPKPQTTRRSIRGILTNHQTQMILMDTPGFHDVKKTGLYEWLLTEVKRSVSEEKPDLVWLLHPAHRPWRVTAPIYEWLVGQKLPFIVVLTQMDRVDREKDVSDLPKLNQAKDVVFVSSLNQEGVEKLIELSRSFIPRGPFLFPDQDQVSDQNIRFLVGEMIRKHLFLCLEEEIPYSCEVQVDRFDEKSSPISIEATIFIERSSQKAIVIGQKGEMIKQIGIHARQEIESFLNQQVYLSLNVKEMKNWTKSQKKLKRLGYSSYG